jgi:hypothetical protein
VVALFWITASFLVQRTPKSDALKAKSFAVLEPTTVEPAAVGGIESLGPQFRAVW